MALNPCGNGTGSGQNITINCGGCGGSGSNGNIVTNPVNAPIDPTNPPYRLPSPVDGGGSGSGPNGKPVGGDKEFYPLTGCTNVIQVGPYANGQEWDMVNIKPLIEIACREFVPAGYSLISCKLSVRASGFGGLILLGINLSDQPYLQIDNNEVPFRDIVQVVMGYGGTTVRYFYVDNLIQRLIGKTEVTLNAKLPGSNVTVAANAGQNDGPCFLELKVCSAVGNRSSCSNDMGTPPFDWKVDSDLPNTLWPGHRFVAFNAQTNEYHFGSTGMNADPAGDQAIFFAGVKQDDGTYKQSWRITVFAFNGGDETACTVNLYRKADLSHPIIPNNVAVGGQYTRWVEIYNTYTLLPEDCYLLEVTHPNTGSDTVLHRVKIDKV